MQKDTVAVIFGGLSGEHVVSLRSAASIMEAIDRDRYQVAPVGITREGQWIYGEDCWKQLWERRRQPKCWPVLLNTDPRKPGLFIQQGSSWEFMPLDIVFPVLHGPYGEDGTIQGLLELSGLPYVGSGVLASAVSMDKVIMKALFKQQELPVGRYLYFFRWHWPGQNGYWQRRVEEELGYPCFVKPANLGSSVGISRVEEAGGLSAAVENALQYDHKIIIESYISGREIECSVLGDHNPRASRPGEIVPCNLFYDYQAKYINDRSRLIVPAELNPELEQKVRDLAVKAFTAVEASGLARVDFFVRPEQGLVILNEINTMPGFTSISMYPKLWEASGISYRELVNRLLELAKSRYQRRRKLKTTPPE
ncbi:MAG TPA: D-alanine--D-alanine ligase [Firmicutes bacterium]|nr:D-alanine--D-alanine ligase [Bacillota bacterium]